MTMKTSPGMEKLGELHMCKQWISETPNIFSQVCIYMEGGSIYSCSFSHTHLVALKPLLGHEFHLLLCHQFFLSSKVRITIVIPLITAIIVSSCCIAGNRWARQHTVVSIWRLNIYSINHNKNKVISTVYRSHKIIAICQRCVEMLKEARCKLDLY